MAWRKNDPSFTQDAGDYAKAQGDFAKAQAELASQKAADADTAAASAKYQWKGTLTDDDALAAVTGMDEGWVFRIKNSASNDNLSRTVRYDGTHWVTTDLQDPTAINTLTAQLDDIMGINTHSTILTFGNGLFTKVEEMDGATIKKRTTINYNTNGTINTVTEEIEGKTIVSTLNYTNGKFLSISKQVIEGGL